MDNMDACETYVAPASCNTSNPPTLIPLVEVEIGRAPLPETGGYALPPADALAAGFLLFALGFAAVHATSRRRKSRQGNPDARLTN